MTDSAPHVCAPSGEGQPSYWGSPMVGVLVPGSISFFQPCCEIEVNPLQDIAVELTAHTHHERRRTLCVSDKKIPRKLRLCMPPHKLPNVLRPEMLTWRHQQRNRTGCGVRAVAPSDPGHILRKRSVRCNNQLGISQKYKCGIIATGYCITFVD